MPFNEIAPSPDCNEIAIAFSRLLPKCSSTKVWQTDPKKGWFTLIRLYRPLEPFFTKTWRPSEIELVK